VGWPTENWSAGVIRSSDSTGEIQSTESIPPKPNPPLTKKQQTQASTYQTNGEFRSGLVSRNFSDHRNSCRFPFPEGCSGNTPCERILSTLGFSPSCSSGDWATRLDHKQDFGRENRCACAVSPTEGGERTRRARREE